MIWLDEDGHIVIKTNLTTKELDQIIDMKNSITFLIKTQDKDFHNSDINYNAFELLSYLEFEANQICLSK